MKNPRKTTTIDGRLRLALPVVSLILLIVTLAGAGDKVTITSPPLVLNYDALYGGYKIGEIDITQSKPYKYEGEQATELECRLESTAIVDIRGLYRSVVTDDYTVLYLFSDVTSSGSRRIDEYWFDYDNEKIRLRTRFPGRSESSEYQLDFTEKDNRYFDTVSLIFRLRDGLDTLSAPFYVPVFTYSRPDSILIERIADDTAAGMDGQPVAAKHVYGLVPFSTFPGFGNRFEIYISDDGKKIPLKAAIQMILGRIEIIPRPTD